MMELAEMVERVNRANECNGGNCEMGGIVQSLRVVGVSGSIGGLRPPMSVSIGVK